MRRNYKVIRTTGTQRLALRVGVALLCALAVLAVASAPATRAGPSAWAQQPTQIAYVRIDGDAGTARDGEPIGDVYVMNADGGGARRLTRNTDVVDEDPAWSPNGRTIAFTSSRAGTFDIWTMNRDGTGLHKVSRRKRGALGDVLYD